MELALVRTEPEVMREPLFPEDEDVELGTPLSIQSTMDVTRMIHAIRAIDRQAELYAQQDQ